MQPHRAPHAINTRLISTGSFTSIRRPMLVPYGRLSDLMEMLRSHSCRELLDNVQYQIYSNRPF